MDRGIFTNESIEDVALLNTNKEKFSVRKQMDELSKGSDIGDFAITVLCETNFKHQRDSYSQKISEAS